MKNRILLSIPAIALVLALSVPAQRPATVPLPPGTILPVPVKELEIRGLELAIPGVSTRTNNLIRLGFTVSASVRTNDVVMSTTTSSEIEVVISPEEILGAQTNYASVAAMPLNVVMPIMYQLGLQKIFMTIPDLVTELQK